MSKLSSIFIIESLPLVLSIIFALTIFVFNRFLPEKLPLFYSLAWGPGQLASQPQLYILPAVAASISLVNLMIYWHIQKSLLLKQILLLSSLISITILIISYAKMVWLFI